jgi:hypothetical protein
MMLKPRQLWRGFLFQEGLKKAMVIHFKIPEYYDNCFCRTERPADFKYFYGGDSGRAAVSHG